MFWKFHMRSPQKRKRPQSPYNNLIWFTPLPWSCKWQQPSNHWHLYTRLHRDTATSQKTAVLNFEAVYSFQWELCSHIMIVLMCTYCLPTKPMAIVGLSGVFYSFSTKIRGCRQTLLNLPIWNLMIIRFSQVVTRRQPYMAKKMAALVRTPDVCVLLELTAMC
jgi:hypothetical protein